MEAMKVRNNFYLEKINEIEDCKKFLFDKIIHSQGDEEKFIKIGSLLNLLIIYYEIELERFSDEART